MADSTTPLLSNILHHLATIDARLSRIETALNIPAPGLLNTKPNPNSVVAPPGTPIPVASHPHNGINLAQQHAHAQRTNAQVQLPVQPPPKQQTQLQQRPPASASNTNTLDLDPALIGPFATSPPQQHQQQLTTPQSLAQAFRPAFNSHPAIKPLEPPPEGFPVSSRAALQEELDAWTVPRGYSMRINGTRTHGSRCKIRLVCFRGGRARPRARSPATAEAVEAARAAGRRKPTTERASKKCDCPFRFELVETSAGAGRFTVHFTSSDGMSHNHGPSADLRVDPRARKIPSMMVDEVDGWLRQGMPISKIQEELRKRGVGTVLDFDLRNRKRTLQRKDGLLGGGPGLVGVDAEQVDIEGVTTHFELDDEDAEGIDDE